MNKINIPGAIFALFLCIWTPFFLHSCLTTEDGHKFHTPSDDVEIYETTPQKTLTGLRVKQISIHEVGQAAGFDAYQWQNASETIRFILPLVNKPELIRWQTSDSLGYPVTQGEYNLLISKNVQHTITVVAHEYVHERGTIYYIRKVTPTQGGKG